MNCRYRFGDALQQVTTTTILTAMAFRLAVTDIWYWCVVGILMCVMSLLCVWLNSKTREQDTIKDLKLKRQLALGVPPDDGI